jgi:hypothetical protein
MAAIDCCCEIISCSSGVGQNRISGMRIDRVLDVRQKLRSGKYNVTEYLDVVVDRLLEDILFQQPPK